MNLKLFFTSVLFFLLHTLSAQVKLGEDIAGINHGDEAGNAVSISGNGKIIAIGSMGYAGNVRILQCSDSTWKPVATLYGDKHNSNFGFSVSLSANGKRLAVGAVGTENDAATMNGRGYTRIFEFVGTEWIQDGQDIIGDAPINLSGWATALSADGNTLAVSAPQYSCSDTSRSMEGVVKVFHYKDSTWQQAGSDIYGDIDSYSGHSLAMSADGNIIAIGNRYGRYVNVYTFKNSNWILCGKAILEDPESHFSFGFSIALSDDGKKIAIGSPLSNQEDGYEQGSIKIFAFRSGQWKQQGQALIGEDRDQYGFSIGLSGNGKILSTSIHKHGSQGNICALYRFEDKKWKKFGYTIFADNDEIFFESFTSLSKDGNRVIIGIPYYRFMEGSVRVYDIQPINIVTPPTTK